MGFEDSIVSWKHSEHGYEVSGENDYTFVIFKDLKYWLYHILSQNDKFS